MTAKHTPGPWTFVKWANEDMREAAERAGLPMIPMLTAQGQRVIMGPGNPPEHIALVTCQAEYKRGAGHHAECEVRDANAALIAAAPELLEALEALISPVGVVMLHDLDRARAAIAKVRGA